MLSGARCRSGRLDWAEARGPSWSRSHGRLRWLRRAKASAPAEGPRAQARWNPGAQSPLPAASTRGWGPPTPKLSREAQRSSGGKGGQRGAARRARRVAEARSTGASPLTAGLWPPVFMDRAGAGRWRGRHPAAATPPPLPSQEPELTLGAPGSPAASERVLSPWGTVFSCSPERETCVCNARSCTYPLKLHRFAFSRWSASGAAFPVCVSQRENAEPWATVAAAEDLGRGRAAGALPGQVR